MKISNSELKSNFVGQEVTLAKKREDIDEKTVIEANIEQQVESEDTEESN